MQAGKSMARAASRVLTVLNAIGILACLAWSLHLRYLLRSDHELRGGDLPADARMVIGVHWSLWILAALILVAVLIAKERIRREWIPLVLNVLVVPAGVLYTLLFTVFMTTASFYVGAGTWVDDPKNWYRSFGEQQPAEVTVVHSRYWGSAHWTEEHQYLFEVQATDEWKDRFLKTHKARPHPWRRGEGLPESGFCSPPDWYAPGPDDGYDTYEAPETGARIFVDKKNGRMYFDHCIL